MDGQGEDGLPFRHLEWRVLEEIQGVAVFRALRLVQGVPDFARHRFLAHQGLVDGKLLLPVRRNGLDADVLAAAETVHERQLLLRQGLEGPRLLQPHPHRVPADPI